MAARMLAKVFNAQYGVRTPMAKGWQLTEEGGRITLSSPDCEETSLALGDELPGFGQLTQVNGLYFLGDQMLELPQTHWLGYQARPVRGKDRYLIDRPGKTSIPIKNGESVNRIGPVRRGAHGHLVVGDKVVMKAEKLRELSLIVLDKVDGVGHLAYFNVLTTTDRSNPNGISGRLVRDARGARFLERGGDDQWYDTARFYDPSGSYVEGALRTLEDAERAAALERQWQALQAEARSLGIEPSDLEEHDSLVADRASMTDTWNRHRFVVASGKDWVQAMVAGQVSERKVG
jgi:hypothetical protein